MIKSKRLEQWIEELKEERLNYYNKQNMIYKELIELSRSANKFIQVAERGTKPRNEWTEETYNEIIDKANNNTFGITFSVEDYIKNKGRFPLYTAEYNGKTLYNIHKNGWTDDMRRSFQSWSIAEYYFYNYESKALYNLLESRKDLEKHANKEVDKYVDSLLARIESRYGKVLNVKDTNLSNVETVSFECENGEVYLEKISAGGHNIQRLHNRLLIKEIK